MLAKLVLSGACCENPNLFELSKPAPTSRVDPSDQLFSLILKIQQKALNTRCLNQPVEDKN
jgi:hypothetical protein